VGDPLGRIPVGNRAQLQFFLRPWSHCGIYGITLGAAAYRRKTAVLMPPCPEWGELD
jgi:hypothetical protein